MTTAMHEIQADAMKLVNVRLLSAIEACDWVAVVRLTERLAELANNGMYHASKEKMAAISAFALNGHTEREAY